jgi:hypothetical protein
MTDSLHILSVGPASLSILVSDALSGYWKCQLMVATGSRELWLLPKHEDVDAAILHCTLSSLELEDASRFIRRQWPSARILVIRAGSEFLDDALYDDRVLPAVASQVLLPTIERLTGRRREGITGEIEW